AYSSDEKVRKTAYESELACYEKIKDSVCFSLNSIKGQVNAICKMRGYTSPLEMTLAQAHMKRETLDAMWKAIDTYLPVFHGYLRKKAELLGESNGLSWYNLFAPVGECETNFTAEAAKEYLVSHFSEFSKDLAQMIETAFDEEWIDFYPHEGKVGGAYCCNIQSKKQSRVLTNFDGSLSDVVTLAHELGHAYHNKNIHDHRILNLDYSMPVAETASTFNENVIMNAAIREASDKDRFVLIESQLQDLTQIICDIYSRYLFETKVFELNQEKFMFADELSEIMLDAQRKAYGDGLNPDTLHPYMWVCKSHYYSGNTNFYNFPYAFGGLFARGLYAVYLKEGEVFLPKYRALLHATTVSDVEEVAAYAGIDLTKPQFWMDVLEQVKQQVEEFTELCDAKLNI
ncbi:MAG: M3 family oligoendopeptidase, partial [Clostridiales bacterium]|nr:M3 family oligoendopeptidase [Clostridiales bacterium]